MAISFLLTILCASTSITLHRALGRPDTAGFISIDCGLPSNSSYVDSETGLTYVSDDQYIDSGVNYNISSVYYTLSAQDSTLRSFPVGTKNCYSLKPVKKGFKYLVRAKFMYGNYEGLYSASEDISMRFALYLGVNHWRDVEISLFWSYYEYEILTVALEDQIWVCLVKMGDDIPFISSLELRPLKTNLYPAVNDNVSLSLHWRGNFGSQDNRTVRFPDDQYDRKWSTFTKSEWITFSSTSPNSTIKHYNDYDDVYDIPDAVLRTGVYPRNGSGLYVSWNDINLLGKSFHAALHFAELAKLRNSDTRTFNITLNDRYWYGPVTPTYLKDFYVNASSRMFGYYSKYNFSLVPAKGSTLPPIINAMEMLRFVDHVMPTYNEDTAAIATIKDNFQIKKNWIADPCVPKFLIWDGLNCTYKDSSPPRITSLNLSSSGLTGEIPAALASLYELEYLDLSDNELTGEIPDTLAQLSSLKFLNLSGNNFTGGVPPALSKKAASGSLILSVSFQDSASSCADGSCKGKKKTSTPVIVIVAVFSSILILTIMTIIWRRKSWRQGKSVGTDFNHFMKPKVSENGLVQSESRQFSFDEIKKICKNFEHNIGGGGYGNVYHGHLENGHPVAVKVLSPSSNQGIKQFLAEAQTLMRTHHRNLVSLVGFCQEDDHLSLVYEYMSNGSLHDHLKGKSDLRRNLVDRTDSAKSLSWKQRLGIALDAAQGLEYLHEGCNPSVIHRDIKDSNILLDENLLAKLADFGLSRVFDDEEQTHVSTIIAGTIGYLDPLYHSTGKLTKMTDVYSFGVVLLQLITGRPAIVEDLQRRHISEWVKLRLAEGDISAVVDSRIQDNYDANSVWRVIDVAMECLIQDLSNRATMVHVVAQLKDAMELVLACERTMDKGEDQNSFVDINFDMSSVVSEPSAR